MIFKFNKHKLFKLSDDGMVNDSAKKIRTKNNNTFNLDDDCKYFDINYSICSQFRFNLINEESFSNKLILFTYKYKTSHTEKALFTNIKNFCEYNITEKFIITLYSFKHKIEIKNYYSITEITLILKDVFNFEIELFYKKEDTGMLELYTLYFCLRNGNEYLIILNLLDVINYIPKSNPIFEIEDEINIINQYKKNYLFFYSKYFLHKFSSDKALANNINNYLLNTAVVNQKISEYLKFNFMKIKLINTF